MASPVPERKIAQIVDRGTVDRSFHALMSDYAGALGRAGRVARFPAGSAEQKSDSAGAFSRPDGPVFGAMVRLLVGTHIRTRLNGVAARCAQFEAALANSPEAGDRPHLAECRTLAEEMAAHLPSLRLPGIFVSIPFAVGLITAASKMPGPLLGIILLVVLIPSLVTMFALMAAYKFKRELFLDGASELDRRQPSAQVEFSGRNVYKSEEDLFVALDSRRPPEARVDYWIVSLGAFLVAELTWVSALAVSASTPITLCALVLGFVALIIGLILERRIPTRVWR